MVALRTRSLARARTASVHGYLTGKPAARETTGETINETLDGPLAGASGIPSALAVQRAPRGARGGTLTLVAAPTRGTITLAAPLGRGWLADLGFTTSAPWWLWAGLLLNVAAWISSWGRIGPWNYTFFPLWFGFILFLDGLNVSRQGSSILTRDWRRFAVLFPISSVYWWIFEWMNSYVQNWFYIYDHHYPSLTLNLLSTLYFSTVLPAVLEVFELLATIPALKPALPATATLPRLRPASVARLVLIGVALLWLPARFPTYAYMLIWFSLIFLLDPINNLVGRPSAIGRWLARDWKFLITLPLAGLICGFFWEMWNFYAMPKWEYYLPYLNWTPHYFEMPLPGLMGYLPFAFELFAMYQFGLLLLGVMRDRLAY